MGGKRFRGLWKISVDDTAMGGRLGSSSGSRHAPAGKADLAVRSDWKMDQRRNAAARQMVLLRSIATVHAVATVKSISGRQYRNASRAGHVDIRSQTRAVSGIAALVTTPLRSLVTSAPSGQASPAPGVRLSPGWLSLGGYGPSGAPACPPGVHRRRGTQPRPWHASLWGSRCRRGQGLWTPGTAWA